MLKILELECGDSLPVLPGLTAAPKSNVLEILPPHHEDSSSRDMIKSSKRNERDDSHLLTMEKKQKPHTFVENLSQNAITNGRSKRGREVRCPKQVRTRKPIQKSVDFNLQDVIFSQVPSKELEEAKAKGMLGRKSATFLKHKQSVEAGEYQPRRTQC